jgi:hypothetical protein
VFARFRFLRKKFAAEITASRNGIFFENGAGARSPDFRFISCPNRNFALRRPKRRGKSRGFFQFPFSKAQGKIGPASGRNENSAAVTAAACRLAANCYLLSKLPNITGAFAPSQSLTGPALGLADLSYLTYSSCQVVRKEKSIARIDAAGPQKLLPSAVCLISPVATV